MAAYSEPQFSNFDDDDDFQDACDTEITPCTMSLEAALEECKVAVDLFFNNRFEEARDLMRPHANSSMYHSVGCAVFTYLQAILTFEHQDILDASAALKQCLQVCQRFRKKSTIAQNIGKTFKRSNYSEYTELEAHSELCIAEALLLKSMITFIEDETLTSFIKGGMKIRHCFASYKECSQVLTQRKWESESSKLHFESGVKMGIGTFNLMISLLPARVIKLLEFIGFSGNKHSGLDDLVTGSHMNGLRRVLCIMTLLSYNLIVCYVLSHQEGDLKFCDRILEEQLTTYPNGVWFLFFKGRLEFMKGNLDEALVWYKKSWKSQNVWPQFHHLCFWELLWVNCLKLDWREATLYASFLCEHSKWSKTIYTYQKAVILSMIPQKELTKTEIRTIEQLMREAPTYKQRIAGKSLPMEKFVVKKTERFFTQDRYLVVPALELMYVWNMFKLLRKSFTLADNVLKIIEKNIYEVEKGSLKGGRFELENRALLYLLKGACLRHMKSPLQAIQCLEIVITLHKDLKEDLYVVPYAIVELGLLYGEQGKKELAVAALEDAKKNYTGYSLESRLHFRIHTALTDLKSNKSEFLSATVASQE